MAYVVGLELNWDSMLLVQDCRRFWPITTAFSERVWKLSRASKQGSTRIQMPVLNLCSKAHNAMRDRVLQEGTLECASGESDQRTSRGRQDKKYLTNVRVVASQGTLNRLYINSTRQHHLSPLYVHGAEGQDCT